MKHILYHICLIFCISANAQLVEIVPDSIASSFDISNKGLFQVLANDVVYSQHTRKDKADAMAYTLAAQNKSVQVISPVSVPETSFKIYVDQSKLNTVSDELLERIDILETQNEIQSNTIGQLLSDVAYIRKSDSIKFAVLENRINTLQTHIRTTADEIIGNIEIIQSGWEVGKGSFTYKGIDNYQYLRFSLNEVLKPGDSIKITFEISEAEVPNLLNFWLYGQDVPSFRLNDTSYANGIHEIMHQVTEERISFAIRARNNVGGAFTISNLKIERI